MKNYIEEFETPNSRWQRMLSACEEGILYCDGYVCQDGRKLYREEYEINIMNEMYGAPSAALRQYFKDTMKEEFLKYWETI